MEDHFLTHYRVGYHGRRTQAHVCYAGNAVHCKEARYIVAASIGALYTALIDPEQCKHFVHIMFDSEFAVRPEQLPSSLDEGFEGRAYRTAGACLAMLCTQVLPGNQCVLLLACPHETLGYSWHLSKVRSRIIKVLMQSVNRYEHSHNSQPVKSVVSGHPSSSPLSCGSVRFIRKSKPAAVLVLLPLCHVQDMLSNWYFLSFDMSPQHALRSFLKLSHCPTG